MKGKVYLRKKRNYYSVPPHGDMETPATPPSGTTRDGEYMNFIPVRPMNEDKKKRRREQWYVHRSSSLRQRNPGYSPFRNNMTLEMKYI